MGELIRAKDWSLTPVGSPSEWPQSLRTSVSIILNSQFPMFVWWGPELTTIYNESYMQIAGNKHSALLGKSGSEAWAEIWDVVGPLAEQVLKEGVSNWAEDQLLYIDRNGYLEETYFTFSYSPVYDETGGIGGVFCACTETTEKVLTNKRIVESEQSFRNLVKEAPVSICIVSGKNYVVEMVNDGMLEFLGRTTDIVGKPIIQSLPEAKTQGLISMFEQVRETGQLYTVSNFPATLLINGERVKKFFNLVFKPHHKTTSSAEVVDIFCVAHNVTEQVLIQQQLEQSEAELQTRVEERTADLQQQKRFINSILDASFNGIYALKAIYNSDHAVVDFKYLFANNNMAQMLHLSIEEVMGSSMLKLIPENGFNGFFELFCKVLQTGIATHDEVFFETKHINSWFDYVIVPIDDDTVVVTIQDITEQKLAAIQIQEQSYLLNSIMKHSPSGITVTEFIRDENGNIIDGKTIVANTISEKFIGLPLDQVLNRRITETDPSILESSTFKNSLRTLETGEPFLTQHYIKQLNKWLEVSIGKMDENRLINVFTDITATKNAELQIVQSIERLAAVFNAAQSGMFTFSPVYNDDNEITDFRFVITNSNFATYINEKSEELKGALGSKYFTDYYQDGLFEMYKRTFITGETQRIDLQLNNNNEQRYLDLMCTKVGEEVLVTFTDYTQLKSTQVELEKHIEELKRSNANLEEFAHAASHDLKEPIRKVRVFSDRLKSSLGSLTTEQQNIFEKVDNATQRMSLLIDDLLEYSHVSMGIDMVEKIDLNWKLKMVINDLEVAINEKQATITIGELPEVLGHRRQLQQVFHNLIQNALKYSKKDEKPIIHISSMLIEGSDSPLELNDEQKKLKYHHIKVEDNGIGFNQTHAEQIFQMFNRLHGKREYEGSGVGLAIVRRVIENHKGYIGAQSELGKGATFHILLPLHYN